ncbi:hypothetical protein [Paraburkholderia sp. SIMBA_054]|uniref:hypothetical protein n=1 Tax=Paraburkholderia sp. SIMBA_054 TaxID=3085795 RepID=UPI00397D0B4A
MSFSDEAPRVIDVSAHGAPPAEVPDAATARNARILAGALRSLRKFGFHVVQDSGSAELPTAKQQQQAMEAACHLLYVRFTDESANHSAVRDLAGTLLEIGADGWGRQSLERHGRAGEQPSDSASPEKRVYEPPVSFSPGADQESARPDTGHQAVGQTALASLFRGSRVEISGRVEKVALVSSSDGVNYFALRVMGREQPYRVCTRYWDVSERIALLDAGQLVRITVKANVDAIDTSIEYFKITDMPIVVSAT